MAVGLWEALPHTKLDLGEMMMLHQMDILVMEAATRDCQILMSPEMKHLFQCSHVIIIKKQYPVLEPEHDIRQNSPFKSHMHCLVLKTVFQYYSIIYS
jgi:hypothetical protein